MTLHETTEFAKKFGVRAAAGVGGIILLVIIFNIGLFIKNLLLPPKIDPPNVKLGALEPIQFPQNSVDESFTYSLNTVDGKLPSDFPDRLVVYPMVVPKPDLNNLAQVKDKVAQIGFTDPSGNAVPEIPRGGSNYEWDDQPNAPIQRKIVFDTVTMSFNMDSNYLTSLDVLSGKGMKDQSSAFTVAQTFLSDINLFPDDINSNLTTNPDPANDYTVAPQLYAIDNSTGKPVKTTNLQDTRIIRVDFYQNPIGYKIIAGTGGDLSHFQEFTLTLPIMYPNPPYSTMDLYVASGPDQAQVMAGTYSHQAVDLTSTTPDQLATYPIKTADEAFADLKSGKGYIAAYNGTDSQITINKVYLAYYIGTQTQSYLMPIVVFEGADGFFGYVSAISDSELKN